VTRAYTLAAISLAALFLAQGLGPVHVAGSPAPATLVLEQVVNGLPPDDLLSHMDELVEGQAAELDYHFKANALRVDGVVDAIEEVKNRLARAGNAAGK
jgi:hypothetical protein